MSILKFWWRRRKKKKKVKVKVTKTLLLQMVKKWELQSKNGFLPKAKKSITFFFLTWFVVFIGPSLRRSKHSSRIFEWTTYSSILPTWVATTLELQAPPCRLRSIDLLNYEPLRSAIDTLAKPQSRLSHADSVAISGVATRHTLQFSFILSSLIRLVLS